MKKYNVYISKEARDDLKSLADYIADVLKAPLTSENYTNGLINELFSLSKYAEAIPLSNRQSIMKYGTNVRRINYKKHAIIYTVQGNTVLIRRIILGSLIK